MVRLNVPDTYCFCGETLTERVGENAAIVGKRNLMGDQIHLDQARTGTIVENVGTELKMDWICVGKRYLDVIGWAIELDHKIQVLPDEC